MEVTPDVTEDGPEPLLVLLPVLSPSGATDPEEAPPALSSTEEDEHAPDDLLLEHFLFLPPILHGQACPHITQHLIPSGTFGLGLLLM